MIRPPRFRGAAFTEADDGDLRHGDRHHCSAELGISPLWATVRQCHGGRVVAAQGPEESGDADGLWSRRPGLPLAVFTADCLGVVVEGDGSVGVAHAGWRGLRAGILEHLLDTMRHAGSDPVRAAVGPSIGPCCFEVGSEVAAEFPDHLATTTWGSRSVDLWAAARAALSEVPEVWVAERCTRCDAGFFSHRRDGTPQRMAAIGWVP